MVKHRYKRPGYKACGKMVMSDASKALKIASSIKNLLNVEFKKYEVSTDQVNVGTAGIYDPMFLVQEGDSDTARSGQQIKAVSLVIKGQVRINPASIFDYIRILLIKDKQPNGVLFTKSSLWETAIAPAIQHQPFLHRNIDNSRRFVVLYDRVLHIDSVGNPQASFHISKRLNIPLRYSGNAGTIADFSETALIFVLISDATASQPTTSYVVRGRYLDN